MKRRIEKCRRDKVDLNSQIGCILLRGDPPRQPNREALEWHADTCFL